MLYLIIYTIDASYILFWQLNIPVNWVQFCFFLKLFFSRLFRVKKIARSQVANVEERNNKSCHANQNYTGMSCTGRNSNIGNWYI